MFERSFVEKEGERSICRKLQDKFFVVRTFEKKKKKVEWINLE